MSNNKSVLIIQNCKVTNNLSYQIIVVKRMYKVAEYGYMYIYLS